MPTVYVWTLSGPVALSPFSPPPSLPPFIGGPVSCGAVYFDQLYLLRVIDRSYPGSYLQNIKDTPNGGYELFQGVSKLMERLSIAIARLECGSFVSTARGGAAATGVVEFYRESGDLDAYTLRQGTIVRTANGKEFRTLLDVGFPLSDMGPKSVAIQATAWGYEYNVAGQVNTLAGELLPGDIGDIKTALIFNALGDQLIDPALSVRNPLPTSGGRDAFLDGLGEDRGLPRRIGESDDAYRLRIMETPDTVSPAAIKRGVDRVLAPYGLGGCLREVGTPLLPGFFYDAGGTGSKDPNPSHNFAYDMDFTLRPEDRFKLFLDLLEFRGFFLVGVPKVVDAEYPGLVYDTAIGSTFKLKNAYDTTSPTAPNAAYDGFQRLNAALYQAIFADINDKRAAGVGFDLYIEEIGCF